MRGDIHGDKCTTILTMITFVYCMASWPIQTCPIGQVNGNQLWRLLRSRFPQMLFSVGHHLTQLINHRQLNWEPQSGLFGYTERTSPVVINWTAHKNLGPLYKLCSSRWSITIERCLRQPANHLINVNISVIRIKNDWVVVR